MIKKLVLAVGVILLVLTAIDLASDEFHHWRTSTTHTTVDAWQNYLRG